MLAVQLTSSQAKALPEHLIGQAVVVARRAYMAVSAQNLCEPSQSPAAEAQLVEAGSSGR